MHTFTSLFDWLLAASARASLLTVVVLLIQAVLRYRIPARWRYVLWLPVLIVLLMPVFPESSWGVSSITRITASPLPQEPSAIERLALPSTPSSSPTATTSTEAVPPPIPWRHIIAWTWLAGAAGILLFGTLAYLHTLRRIKRHRQPISDSLQRELALLAQEVGLRRAPHVWLASTVHSPAVTGILRPTLLLPAHFEETLSPDESRLVLKHELTHIKRGDLPVNALLCLLLALHWFNPLLWLAFFKARLDREAACDAQVLAHEDQPQRVAYGHTLLKVETSFRHQGLSLGFVGIFQRGLALRARIHSIASRPSQHPLMKTALALAIVLLTFLGVTKAATLKPIPQQIVITTKFVEITSEDKLSEPVLPKVALPALLETGAKVPGILRTVTDPDFQLLIRELSQRKGVDLMAAPSVTTNSGRQAKVEVVREFIYPDKTIVPNTEEVGVSMTVLPTLKDHDQIALDLTAQIKEFEGFKNPKTNGEHPVFFRKVMRDNGDFTETTNDMKQGKAIESTFDAQGHLLSTKAIPLMEVKEEPIFSKREVKADTVITSGHTIAIEMTPRTDTQLVEETDGSDRVISSKTVHYTRRTLVFVTARLLSPSTTK